MKKTFFSVALFTVFFAINAYAVNTTRYWDGCKPSCGWSSNASGSPNGTCKSCNVSGSVLNDDNAKNSCESGGSAYTCLKQVPWKVSDNLSYGFAASHTNGDCGKCFELSFTNTSISGKKMVIMVSNIGGDVGQNQFDLMIPGGGVGQFNSISGQIQQNGGNSSNMGAQFGGFRTTCGNSKDCVRKMCNDVFGSAALADMKAGCEWYVDWFDIADNPQANSVSVTCPADLVNKYKGQFNSTPTPTPTTYTLTVNKNPTAGGTTTPASSQANISGGSQVNISATAASGYTFSSWTLTSGSGTIANANSANTTVTVNGNVTVTANFTQSATTYTLTVGRNPTDGGTTNISSQTNINAGQQVNITATAASGYTFNNWTISGSGTIAAASNASTSVTVNGNVTVTANFTKNPTNYTLTVNRDPSASAGTVNVSNNAYSAPVTVAGGTAVNISATAASGYTFSRWAVTSGTAQINNQNSASTSVTLSANATITAYFTAVNTTVNYTLTVSRLPDNAAGTVNVSNAAYSAPVTVTGGTAVNISATAVSGYRFTSWTVSTGSASIANASSATTTVTLSANATVTANFTSTVTPPSGGGGNGDTIKVEAENYTSKNGPNMQIGEVEGGGACIGYIESGYSTTYNVTAPKTGDYTVQLRVATGNERSSFTVTVNGQNAGTISTNNTGGWDSYVTIALSSKARFNAGNNVVVLDFQNAVNVDYILIIGEKTTSVKYVAPKATATVRTQIAVRPTARGFTASLPAGHGFTSYKVVDMLGKEVKSGNIGGGVNDLSVGGLKHSVVFLRLEGSGKSPFAVKVVTY